MFCSERRSAAALLILLIVAAAVAVATIGDDWLLQGVGPTWRLSVWAVSMGIFVYIPLFDCSNLILVRVIIGGDVVRGD
jgi:uncharacterized oligopeptide transporter (OPT) family protein